MTVEVDVAEVYKRLWTVCGGKFPTCRSDSASWKLAATKNREPLNRVATEARALPFLSDSVTIIVIDLVRSPSRHGSVSKRRAGGSRFASSCLRCASLCRVYRRPGSAIASALSLGVIPCTLSRNGVGTRYRLPYAALAAVVLASWTGVVGAAVAAGRQGQGQASGRTAHQQLRPDFAGSPRPAELRRHDGQGQKGQAGGHGARQKRLLDEPLTT